MLRRTMNDTVTGGPVMTTVKTLTIRNITLEVNVYYLLFEEISGKEFTGTTEFFRELKWTKPGDKVEVSYGDNLSPVVPLDSFDNLDFNI